MVTEVTAFDRSVRLVHPVPGLRWTESRDAAADYAAHGWSVLPGTYQVADDSVWLGKPGAMGLEPVAAMWAMASTTDAAVATQWWTQRPYSVLLACGGRVDAIEVRADHGYRAQALLAGRGDLGPIVVTPHGNWLLLVRSGGEIRRGLAAAARLRARGDWIPLPPTSSTGVPYRWRVNPGKDGWTLPDASEVQQSLLDSLSTPGVQEEQERAVIARGSDVD
jgi:hypothetical protein